MVLRRDIESLGPGGLELWDCLNEEHDLDETQQLLLLFACRDKDMLDRLDAVLRGDGSTFGEVVRQDGTRIVLTVNDTTRLALVRARSMAQTLRALRLPDKVTGKRPQRRGGARGAYRPGK